MSANSWTIADLQAELSRFEAEARQAGLAEGSVRTYVVDRGILFAGLLVNSISKARDSS